MNLTTNMLTVGKAPFIECSTIGDINFSGFYAKPASLEGQNIEEAYQAMKVFADGSTGLTWPQSEWNSAVNQDECEEAYKMWWVEWIFEKDLLDQLKAAKGLSDTFGQKKSISQITVLWEIRNEY